MFNSSSVIQDLDGKLVLIWGCAGHAAVLIDTIISRGGKVIAFIDMQVKISLLDSVPVFSNPQACVDWCISQGYQKEILCGVAAIGRSGKDRLSVQNFFRAHEIIMPCLIHPLASISPQATIGNGSQILPMAIVAAKALINDICIINHRATVDHECILERGVTLAPGTTLCGSVHVGENVFIGAGAIVSPRLNIGAGATIGAGAVVICDVPPGDIVVGNPARSIKFKSL